MNPKSNPNAKNIQVFLKGIEFYIINKLGTEKTNQRGKKTLLCLNQNFSEKGYMQCKLQKNEICYKSIPSLDTIMN